MTTDTDSSRGEALATGVWTVQDHEERGHSGGGSYRRWWSELLCDGRHVAHFPDADEARFVLAALSPIPQSEAGERDAWLPHQTGYALSFLDGTLNINRDGSGSLAFREDALEWEETESGDYRFQNLPASELLAIRDALNARLSTPPAQTEGSGLADLDWTALFREAKTAWRECRKSGPIENSIIAGGEVIRDRILTALGRTAQ